METYLPGGAKAIAVYDAGLNCLTSAKNENNYYILTL